MVEMGMQMAFERHGIELPETIRPALEVTVLDPTSTG